MTIAARLSGKNARYFSLIQVQSTPVNPSFDERAVAHGVSPSQLCGRWKR